MPLSPILLNCCILGSVGADAFGTDAVAGVGAVFADASGAVASGVVGVASAGGIGTGWLQTCASTAAVSLPVPHRALALVLATFGVNISAVLYSFFGLSGLGTVMTQLLWLLHFAANKTLSPVFRLSMNHCLCTVGALPVIIPRTNPPPTDTGESIAYVPSGVWTVVT